YIAYVDVCVFFFFQAEDGIRDFHVTGVQTCALPISALASSLLVSAALAVPGTLVHLALGHIDWTVTFTLALTSIPASRAGARVRSEERRVGKEGRCRWSR